MLIDVVYSVFSLGICVLFCFFFQAEDGIRDLVRSRGLGDVYKRQLRTFAELFVDLTEVQVHIGSSHAGSRIEVLEQHRTVAVSYTHLTLPTSDLV